jgi:thymidylate kinase
VLAAVLEVIDSAVATRVLLFGSLPPDARDLDVLARPSEEAAVGAELARRGFTGHHGTWVRFRSCGAEVVDLVGVAEWGLPPSELDTLFSEARPVAGTTHVTRPAPHHVLLIQARLLVHGDGRLGPKRRRRIAAAEAEDPDAWRRARERAPAWRAGRALEQLWAAHQRYRRASPLARAAARRELRAGRAVPVGRAALRRLGTASRRRHGAAVISLSGLDGSGKSSQAEALCRTLEQLGLAATVEWTRLAYESRALLVAAYPVKLVLGLLARGAAAPAAGGQRAASEGDPLRQRSRTVAYAWSTIVAMSNGAAHRQATGRHLRSGCTVVCDRYTLDSAVFLHHRYGAAGNLGLQLWLVRLLSPRPRLAYFLDVAPETARARKPEQFDVEELRAQAGLYRALHRSLGVRRLDGEAAPEEVCAQIAREAWAALR